MTDTRQALAERLQAWQELAEWANGGWNLPAAATEKLRKLCADARAALSAQPVAGAVATDETGWLIEHSGEILPGAEQRAQVSWLRVQMKFNGYGAREFGFTHDANEALRFARKEDAEAVLAMHLGASPPDWYSKPFSVTEHMWPLVPQAQAAPEPEPSAQNVAELPDEIRVPLHRLWADAGYLIGRAKTGNTDLAVHTIKALCDELERAIRAMLAASPQPEPSDEAECEHATIRYMLDATAQPAPSAQGESVALKGCTPWRALDYIRTDEELRFYVEEHVRIALASAPSTPPPADPIDIVLHCPACGLQHIDAPDERTPDWKNEPHRSHLCHGCGHIWRPADVPTNGVQATKTKGKADSPPHAVVEAVPLTDEQACEFAALCVMNRRSRKTARELLVEYREELARGIAPKAAHAVVEAVPLTDEQIDALPMDEFVSGVRRPSLRAFARAVESELRGIAPKAAQEKTDE